MTGAFTLSAQLLLKLFSSLLVILLNSFIYDIINFLVGSESPGLITHILIYDGSFRYRYIITPNYINYAIWYRVSKSVIITDIFAFNQPFLSHDSQLTAFRSADNSHHYNKYD